MLWPERFTGARRPARRLAAVPDPSEYSAVRGRTSALRRTARDAVNQADPSGRSTSPPCPTWLRGRRYGAAAPSPPGAAARGGDDAMRAKAAPSGSATAAVRP